MLFIYFVCVIQIAELRARTMSRFEYSTVTCQWASVVPIVRMKMLTKVKLNG